VIAFSSSDRNGWIANSKTSAQWYRQCRCKHVNGYANDGRAEWHEVEVDGAGSAAVAPICKKREIDMKFKLRVVQCLTLLVSLGTGGETEEPDTVHKYQRI